MADHPLENPSLKAACLLIPGASFDEESQSCILPAGKGGTLPTVPGGQAKLPGHTIITDDDLAELEATCAKFKSQRMMFGVGAGVGGLVIGGLLGYMAAR